eukprot:211128-Chlamydomonas_euryale.AAC.9
MARAALSDDFVVVALCGCETLVRRPKRARRRCDKAAPPVRRCLLRKHLHPPSQPLRLLAVEQFKCLLLSGERGQRCLHIRPTLPRSSRSCGGGCGCAGAWLRASC